MSDTFFLPRQQQVELADLLYPSTKAPAHIWAASIPSLLEDLTVAISRQDRMGNGMRICKGTDEQPLPVNMAAVKATDELHNELQSWVKLVMDQRKLEYTGGNDTLSLARWLKRWVVALALTDGSQDALESIQRTVNYARRAVDRRADTPPDIDPARLAEADALILSAAGIATLAKQLGPKYRTLTARRVSYLHEAGHVQPVPAAGNTRLFLVGDIRRAHITQQEAQEALI